MNNLEISCHEGSIDANLFTSIYNEGIDSYLEAFTKSKFKHKNGRITFWFHKNEMSILLRRLSKYNTENVEIWIDDIIQIYYGIGINEN